MTNGVLSSLEDKLIKKCYAAGSIFGEYYYCYAKEKRKKEFSKNRVTIDKRFETAIKPHQNKKQKTNTAKKKVSPKHLKGVENIF